MFNNTLKLLDEYTFLCNYVYTNNDNFIPIIQNKYNNCVINNSQYCDLIVWFPEKETIAEISENIKLLERLNPGGIILYVMSTRSFKSVTNIRNNYPNICKYNVLNITHGYGKNGKPVNGKTVLIIQNSIPTENNKHVIYMKEMYEKHNKQTSNNDGRKNNGQRGKSIENDFECKFRDNTEFRKKIQVSCGFMENQTVELIRMGGQKYTYDFMMKCGNIEKLIDIKSVVGGGTIKNLPQLLDKYAKNILPNDFCEYIYKCYIKLFCNYNSFNNEFYNNLGEFEKRFFTQNKNKLYKFAKECAENNINYKKQRGEINKFLSEYIADKEEHFKKFFSNYEFLNKIYIISNSKNKACKTFNVDDYNVDIICDDNNVNKPKITIFNKNGNCATLKAVIETHKRIFEFELRLRMKNRFQNPGISIRKSD